MTTEDSYAEIAPFYDLEFDAFDADVELYLGYASMVGGPILELGCGTGRLLEPLARTGFPLTGLDNSPAMIEQARKRLSDSCGDISLVHGEMQDLRAFDQHMFRLVIVAVNSFLHLETRETQLEALRQIRRVIDRDGLLLIDVFNPTPSTLARMDDHYAFDSSWTLNQEHTVQRFSQRHLDSAEQMITTRLFYDVVATDGSLRRRSTMYTMRYVHRFELELLLENAGFEVEGIYGSYSLDPFEHDSEQLIAVAHRTPNPGEA
jgi:ubiquinone/menaquinone biosynthesis C-methylase UbiE